ncbi:MAG TPA: DUF4177 domain-containing protein [Candidatus Paceibacterota bacterium]|nr:DUF4177 domain-containing protein [Verrucomicrobiota bacterium]HSA12262.1 DUF4177 domain-containing protein [Candidatus Paceibacterota bacterium]
MAVIFAASTLLLAGCCTTPRAGKWEYKVASPGGLELRYPEGTQQFLNRYGKEGWVLVSQSDGRVFYFKRRVK